MKWGIELGYEDDQKPSPKKLTDRTHPCSHSSNYGNGLQSLKTHGVSMNLLSSSRYAGILWVARKVLEVPRSVRWIPKNLPLHRPTTLYECVHAKLLWVVLCVQSQRTQVFVLRIAWKNLTVTTHVRLCAVGHFPTRPHRGREECPKCKGWNPLTLLIKEKVQLECQRGGNLGAHSSEGSQMQETRGLDWGEVVASAQWNWNVHSISFHSWCGM